MFVLFRGFWFISRYSFIDKLPVGICVISHMSIERYLEIGSKLRVQNLNCLLYKDVPCLNICVGVNEFYV